MRTKSKRVVTILISVHLYCLELFNEIEQTRIDLIKINIRFLRHQKQKLTRCFRNSSLLEVPIVDYSSSDRHSSIFVAQRAVVQTIKVTPAW